MPDLITVGHGALRRPGLTALLHYADVELLVDLRGFPASRVNPDVRREALQDWLPMSGVAYRWEEGLGGRRLMCPGEAAVDTWWSVPAFRAYAAHTRTAAFRSTLDTVLAAVDHERVAVMCSESLWWRCHRRLIADVAVLGHGVLVQHLLPSGRLHEHQVATGARVGDDGLLIWDGAPA